MNFKVGDKVKAIDNFHSYASKESQFVGVVRKVLSSFEMVVETISNTNKARIGMWYRADVTHFELVRQTEFTLQEVITRNIPGIYVNCNNVKTRVQSIEINERDDLTINANFSVLNELNLGLGVHSQTKFKLQEPKKKVKFIVVEHGKGKKPYEFIGIINQIGSCGMINEGDFVECDTKYGSSYGRCVGIIIKELTESEIKEYKKCWRA